MQTSLHYILTTRPSLPELASDPLAVRRGGLLSSGAMTEETKPVEIQPVEIQPADPRFRKRFLIATILIMLLIAVGLHGLNEYLLDLHALAKNAQSLAAGKAMLAVRIVLGLVFAGGTVLGLQLARTSWRTIESERFPPPGARMVSDTRIRRGRDARRQGWMGLIMAILILLLTLATTLWAHAIFQDLLYTKLRPTPFQVSSAS